VNELPIGYPPCADARGNARKRHNGKVYSFGRWGTRASVKAYAEWIQGTLGLDGFGTEQKKSRASTVSGIIAAWLEAEAKEKGLDHKEIKGIVRALVPLERLYGRTFADDFRASRLQQVQVSMISGSWMTQKEKDSLAKTGKTHEWSRNYVNKQIDRITRIFRWAESQELVPTGTWHHLRSLPPVSKSNRKVRQNEQRLAVDWDKQVVPVLPHLSPQLAAIAQVQYYTGARPTEILHMRVDEVDRNGPNGSWVFRPKSHKGGWRGLDRVILIGPQAQSLLAPFLLTCESDDSPIFRPCRGSKKTYTGEAYSQAIRRACAKLQIKPWTPYQLRHTARLRITRLFGLDAARAHLGHQSHAMTSEYAKATDIEIASKVARDAG
jgi:integrase